MVGLPMYKMFSQIKAQDEPNPANEKPIKPLAHCKQCGPAYYS